MFVALSIVGKNVPVADVQWLRNVADGMMLVVRFAMVVTSHDATLATRRALPPT